MSSLMGPKCFLASSFFIITILSVYGIVGAAFNYLQSTHVHDIGEWPFNSRPIFVAFTAVQSLFPIAGFFAALVVCRKQPVLLYISGSILLIIFTFTFVLGIVTYLTSSQEILESYYKTFRTISNNSKILNWMNEIQWQHRCCGVYSYNDWYAAENLLGDPDKIPSSCCINNHPYIKDCGADLSASGSKKDTEEKIHSQGCGEKLTSMRKQVYERIGIEMSICALVSLLAAVFIYAGVTKYFAGVSKNSFTQNGGRGQPPTTSGKLEENSIGTLNDDENNNKSSTNSRKDFHSRRRQRPPVKIYKSRDLQGSNLSVHGPFASIHSQGRFARSSRHNIKGSICRSKSFILGDAHSNLLSPICEEKNPEILRKNVDMLWYQSLDKNMSTLSTTPNDISSMLLPGMVLQNKKTWLGYEVIPVGTGTGINDDQGTQHQNIEYTVCNEQPFSPSISQNCSASIISNNTTVKLPVAAAQEAVGLVGLGQNSSKQRQINKVPESSDEILEENKLNTIQDNNTEFDVINTTAQFNTSTEGTQLETKENDSDDSVMMTDDASLSISPQGNNGNVLSHPSQPSSKFLNPTSSVRSSTLATIQEESESTKGSPVNTKGGSPATGTTPETVSPQPTQTELFPMSDKDGINNANNNIHELIIMDSSIANKAGTETISK